MMNIQTQASDSEQTFRNSESGGISIMNLFFVVAMAILAGIAIDVTNVIQARTQLQVAADTAAHAALYKRDDDALTVQQAKQAALDIAAANMPTSKYGDVLRIENIHFGDWDRDTQTFTVDETSRNAVYVKADRLSENSNSVGVFLLQFIGLDEWDVVTPSVFELYRETCPFEGIVGEDPVEIQSNNSFVNGFCIHSNDHFITSQNNMFEPGTIVSMPDINDIELPSSGFEKNEGLQAALREGRLRIRILNRLDDIWDGMVTPSSRYYRDFITNPNPITDTFNGNNNQIAMADLSPGRVHDFTCNGSNSKITFAAETFSEIVIRTNCEFKMSQGTAFEDATIITTDTDDNSITAPNGLRLGADDGCADGGSVQMVTYGGVAQASDVSIFGSQILAAGPIAFAASNDGIEGASIVSGETVDLTSGSSMGFCGSGMGDNFEAYYFRMAT